jgi:hypothetical protein
MDPDETLRTIRDLVAQIRGGTIAIHETGKPQRFLGDELADHVTALDTWLTGGGFPPREWVS